jgi:AAA+ ATPase superfamily predicted ATPase
MFIGREKELQDLNNLHSQNRFHLFILYGRRRVGKTTLLTEFCEKKEAIFFSAENSNEKLNLNKFSNAIFQYYQETNLEAFSSFENAIKYIHDRQEDKQLILVLDEFPYLANINRGLTSVLQHLVDHLLKNSKLFIVLCGSYMGFMEEEVLGAKSPLFGRRTSQLHLKPFDYHTSLEFLKGFTAEEQFTLYGVLGGTAMYLEQVRCSENIEENIKKLFLSQIGYLYEEPLLLLKQEVQEPGVYYAIVESIAMGAVTANEISQKSGESTAKCLKYISVLRRLGIVYKEAPLGEKETGRKARYGISDFMFRFWFRYVSPNKSLLETDAKDIVWKRRILPNLGEYMGHAFEIICKEYLIRRNSKGNLPILATQIGRWWGTDSKTKKQVEIDLIARDGDDYIFCECKWRNELMKVSVFRDLEKKADIFSPNRKKTWFFLFSKSGFEQELVELANVKEGLVLIDLEGLVNGRDRRAELMRLDFL